jgi:hypothetical protein
MKYPVQRFLFIKPTGKQTNKQTNKQTKLQWTFCKDFDTGAKELSLTGANYFPLRCIIVFFGFFAATELLILVVLAQSC